MHVPRNYSNMSFKNDKNPLSYNTTEIYSRQMKLNNTNEITYNTNGKREHLYVENQGIYYAWIHITLIVLNMIVSFLKTVCSSILSLTPRTGVYNEMPLP